MYNDEIMALCIIISIYYCAKNRPLLGSFWFTMGLSIKAGAVLMIPSILGQIQYNHGTFTLFKSIFIILGF